MPAATQGGPSLRRERTQLTILLGGLTASLPLLLVGCGGSDDSTTPEPTAAESSARESNVAESTPVESWADDACSAIGAWIAAIADARSTLSAPREVTVNELED